jgi:hypothetical protein
MLGRYEIVALAAMSCVIGASSALWDPERLTAFRVFVCGAALASLATMRIAAVKLTALVREQERVRRAPAAKPGPSVLFCEPNSTNSILLAASRAAK